MGRNTRARRGGTIMPDALGPDDTIVDEGELRRSEARWRALQSFHRAPCLRQSLALGALGGLGIGMLRYMRKQITDGMATLTVLLKLPWRLEGVTNCSKLGSLHRCREWLAIPPSQSRLRIKGIDLTRSTIHVKKDDRLGACWNVTTIQNSSLTSDLTGV